MEILTANYEGKPISFLRLPDNGLLLRTKDICNVLGIVERPANSVLGEPCLDLASAVRVAVNDPDFAMWLNETFAGYNLKTSVHFRCDDDWTFQ